MKSWAVFAVGNAVTKFKVGDLAAVGCLVDSCRTCPSCREGMEQFCEVEMVLTYNGRDKHLGGHTLGGYSRAIVVDEAYTLRGTRRARSYGCQIRTGFRCSRRAVHDLR